MKLYEPFQFLTANECDKIIAYGNERRKIQGYLDGKDNLQLRNNRIVWYEDSAKWSEWIKMFNTIEDKIRWIQTPQIAFYTPGEYYNWHNDQGKSQRTDQRYFTLTCNLQIADGSQFEIENKNIPKMKKGEAVIFYSTDKHRAITPASGERISLTIWAMARNYHPI